MCPNIVPYPESLPSSESPSTPSRRPRRGRRRDYSPGYDDSRTRTPSTRRDFRPSLTVTNGPEVPLIPGTQPGPPPIRVVSPSASPSLHAQPLPFKSFQPGQAQPTVILQQPPIVP